MAAHDPIATYNVLHDVTDEEHGTELVPLAENYVPDEDYDDEDDDYDHAHNHHHHKTHEKALYESFDFNDSESMMWRKV